MDKESPIGQRIYDLRIERDIQQGELANAVGLQVFSIVLRKAAVLHETQKLPILPPFCRLAVTICWAYHLFNKKPKPCLLRRKIRLSRMT